MNQSSKRRKLYSSSEDGLHNSSSIRNFLSHENNGSDIRRQVPGNGQEKDKIVLSRHTSLQNDYCAALI